MSIWSDNPEWFDEWIERKASEGDFGPVIQYLVECGDLIGTMHGGLWELADASMLGPESHLLSRDAETDYCERFAP